MTRKQNTFYCEYSILNDQSTRDTCMTLFGGMTEEDDKRELGDVTLLGRWSCVGEARGFCIAQADSVVSIQKWLNNWIPMANIKVVPCLDDNQHRELILGGPPPFTVSYNSVNNSAKIDEDLYFIKYKFKDDSISKGFQTFASLTKEQDSADSGKCTSYGRWHVPSQGCGYAIASSPTVLDIYKWAYNWQSLCECLVTPVTRDEDTRSIIKEGLGYDIKHAQLSKKMKALMSGPAYVNATFTFKNADLKKKFIDILNGKEGLSVTRNWPGCQFIECYESGENPLTLTIRQKWNKKSDHKSYLEMRKKSGLFDKLTDMISSPLEINHLNPLKC